MNKFGVQYFGKSSEVLQAEGEKLQGETAGHAEIREVLRKFQDGYTERDMEKADTFVEEIFVSGEDDCVLGTGTGELFLGSEQIKTLIKDDWEYWGDVNIDWEGAHIFVEGETACFAAMGSVKQTFKDTPERYDSYVNFIKEKAEDSNFTAKQRITFINWVLALTYHQREGGKRKYLLPLRLSGVLLKDDGKWKFVHLQFSLPKANFPDERFENSGEHIEEYNKQNAMAYKYRNNQMNLEIKSLLKSLESELIGQKNISGELVQKYFIKDSMPYIIGAENQWCLGVDEVREYFAKSSVSTISLDLEHAIASKSGEIIWVTVTGTLKQELTEDELAEGALKELGRLFEADIASKDKLFAAHRSIACALKESASGSHFTCPIRLTAVILNRSEGPVFHHIHFSFPSYWILEGKTDSI